MSFPLPKTLTEGEWKKHKAALATDTGISDKLRKLAPLAAAFDLDDEASCTALSKHLMDLNLTAGQQAKKLSAAFAKTKTYLVQMSTAADKAWDSVEERVKAHKEKIKSDAENEKKLKEFEAREALKAAASNGKAKFIDELKKYGATLDYKVGDSIKIQTAMREKKQDELKKLVKETLGIDLVVGQLIKLTMV